MKRVFLSFIVLTLIVTGVFALAFPTKPVIDRVKAKRDSVTVTWEHDRQNIVWYEARLFISNQVVLKKFIAPDAPLTVTFDNLKPGTAYKFLLGAVNRDQATQRTVTNWITKPLDIKTRGKAR